MDILATNDEVPSMPLKSSRSKTPVSQQKVETAEKVIDIYDPNLTAKEMKNIKQQVRSDVSLLRNRVRMLKLEHERAQKKIDAATAKAEEVEKRKLENE